MKTLLGDDIWSVLQKEARNHSRIQAAIAYVTEPYLDLSEGDLLVCDASPEAIKGGLTAAKTLRRFFNNGAAVYSLEGLHAKVAIIDSNALIGSANMSKNAGTATYEASLLTSDRQVVGLIRGYIEQIKNEAIELDDDLLRKLEAIKVERRGGPVKRKRKKINVGQARVWFVATYPLSERIQEAERDEIEAGMEEAGEIVTASRGSTGQRRRQKKLDDYSIGLLRMVGRARFREEAKPGDLIIECCTTKKGARKFVTVEGPFPIVHRKAADNCIHFYYEKSDSSPVLKWRDAEKAFRTLGIANLKPGSTRELTGTALGILDYLGA